MGDVAIDGLVEITGPAGLENTTVIPTNVLYSGAKAQWRNVVYPVVAPLLPGINKFTETSLVPLRVNPDNGALWVDNTASKFLTRKSGKFTGSTTVTVSSELITSGLTQSIYLSYGAYQLTQEAEIWFSYSSPSSGGGTGQSVPSSLSFLRFLAPAKGIIAKDFGDSRVCRGAQNFSLWLNVAAATPAPDVRWNVFYSIEDEYY